MTGFEAVATIVAFAVGFLALGFSIPLLATLFELWNQKLLAWERRALAEKPGQLPQQAEIERLADELTEAHAEIQRLRTELAERGGMR